MKTFAWEILLIMVLLVQNTFTTQTIDQIILAAQETSQPDYIEEAYDDYARSVETDVRQRSEGIGGRNAAFDADESGDTYDTPIGQDTRTGLVDRRTSMSPQENTDTVLIEYDMVFKKDMWDRMQGQTSRRKRKAVKPGTRFTNQELQRWTNNQIPYVINDGFSSDDRSKIKAAMDDWETYTCLSFVPKRSSDRNYVDIVAQGPCSSYIGMVGDGLQRLTLGIGCREKNIIIHELGHTIGFVHEQSRPDRDDYVTIYNENIKKNQRTQFSMFGSTMVDNHEVPYDYLSIMHYGAYFASARGCRTIMTKDPRYKDIIGKAQALSFNDVKLANLMYSCNAGCVEKTCPPEGFQGKDCECWCKGNPIRLCSSIANNMNVDDEIPDVDTREDKNKKCRFWAERGECAKNPWMIPNCPISCDNCTYRETRIRRDHFKDSEYYPLSNRMSWVSAGPSGVFGIKPNGSIYYLQNSRLVENPSQQLLNQDRWTRIRGRRFQSVAVGTDLVAAVDVRGRIYYRPGIQDDHPVGRYWEKSVKEIKTIVLSGHIDQLWGVDDEGLLMYLPQVSASKRGYTTLYRQQSGCLDVGISKYGIWIVKTNHKIYYRNHDGTNQVHEDTTGWNLVQSDTSFRQLSAEGSEKWVVAVDTSGHLHIRLGITPRTPMGTGWRKIDSEFGDVSQVSVYKNQMWLTTPEKAVYTRTLMEWWLN